MSRRIRAVLFDIDNTMLNLFALHKVSYAQVFEDIFSIRAGIDDIAFSGKTTPNIFREVCLKHGLPNDFVEARLAAACDYLTTISEQKLRALGDDIQQYVLPGVRALLDDLQESGLTLGVLSGNPPDLGHLVLKCARLHTYFRLFTFGTEANTRGELAQLSLYKLRALIDPQLQSEQIVIIGDATADMQAALQIGALSMAVATGFHSYSELAALGPHWLFPDLADTAHVLAALDEK